MQPFLNTQFVEVEHQRRETGVSAADPDGIFPEQHGMTPDPIGRIFTRVAAWIENAGRAIFDRSNDAQVAGPDVRASIEKHPAPGRTVAEDLDKAA